jgi:hypothetical protein
MAEAGVAPGPHLPAHAPDELMERFGGLPLVHQPGEKWLYNTTGRRRTSPTAQASPKDQRSAYSSRKRPQKTVTIVMTVMPARKLLTQAVFSVTITVTIG